MRSPKPSTERGSVACSRIPIACFEWELFVANNTDGPGNPLSKVYSRAQAIELFNRFETVDLAIRHLNLRVIPGGEVLSALPAAESIGRRAGWHLYVRAVKP